jgi:hypothetical protein
MRTATVAASSSAPVLCQYCCPRNYTETFYHDQPSSTAGVAEWARHPAVFLVQTSSTDAHADLCASRYYHAAMLEHNVSSSLWVVPMKQVAAHAVDQITDPIDQCFSLAQTIL